MFIAPNNINQTGAIQSNDSHVILSGGKVDGVCQYYWYNGSTTQRLVDMEVNIDEDGQEVIADGNLSSKVTYSSANPAVAIVSKTRKVTAKKAGKTTITTTITVNGVTNRFKTAITVKKSYIKLTKSSDIMTKGKNYVFVVKGYGVDSKKITWTTTKKSIVKNKKFYFELQDRISCFFKLCTNLIKNSSRAKSSLLHSLIKFCHPTTHQYSSQPYWF